MLLLIRPAMATPEALQAAIANFTSGAVVGTGRVELQIAELVENGNAVPVTISVDSPMTEQAYVKSIHLFAEKNHLPRILDAKLGPYNGKAFLATRVRMATSQQMMAVAEMSDGSLWSAAADIEVISSDCGL